MFRLSLGLCMSLLLYGITAKPFKMSGEVADAAFQETLMDWTEGKMSLGLKEVEPPEDMDVTDYDINLAIWKNMRDNGQEEKYQKAEKDSDDLYHPSMEQNQMGDLLQDWAQPEDTFPWADVQTEPLEEEDNLKYYQEADVEQDAISLTFLEQVDPKEPEVDWDEVYHPETMEGGDGTYQVVVSSQSQEELIPQGGDFHRVYTVSEEDMDDIYHGDMSVYTLVDLLPKEAEIGDQNKVINHMQPEDDRDAIYHADPLASLPDHEVADPPVAALLPDDQTVQRKHSQPEVDLDHLYHH